MDLSPIRPRIVLDRDRQFLWEVEQQYMLEIARTGMTKHGDVRCPWRKGFFGRLFCLHLWKKGSQTRHSPLIFGARFEWHCVHCGKTKVYPRGDGPISYFPESYFA